MFGFIEDAVDNILDIGDDLLSGELPTKRQLAKLIDDGVSIYAISEVTGYSTDVIEAILED